MQNRLLKISTKQEEIMKGKNLGNKSKRIITVTAAITMIAIIAGSLAYWNQTHTVENPFSTGGKFGSTVIEDFTPDGEWQPGATVNKAVRVENTGDQDIILRVKMDEKWVLKGATTPYKEFKAEPDGDVYKINQVSSTDGTTAADDSVVIKHFSDSVNWVDGGDGWFYYKSNLAKGETTDQWLESVELLNNLDVGAQEVLHYATTDLVVDADTTWVAYQVADGMPKVIDGQPVLHNKTEVVYKKDAENNELMGYLNSNYTLTITTQTVQATKEAVMATFALSDEQLDALAVTWEFAD